MDPGANGGPKSLTLGPIDMPAGGTFEIGTQIIFLKIDGFLKGWITPLKGTYDSTAQYSFNFTF